MDSPEEIIAAVYLNAHVRVMEDPKELGRAVMTALRAEGWAVVPAALESTVTEWALAYTHRPSIGLAARRVVQPYPDEAEARAAVAELLQLAPQDEPALTWREIGPWKEANA